MNANTILGSFNSAENNSLISQCTEELKILDNAVSGRNLCETENAQRLFISDLSQRLLSSARYDIGGTYTNEEPDIWFYYTTIVCAGPNFLMSIFAYHRKVGTFSIGISESNELNNENGTKSSIAGVAKDAQHHILLTDKLSWKTFVSAKTNVSHHIKTYCFSEEQIKCLEDKILLVPISVRLNPEGLDKETEQGIKNDHAITMSSLVKKNKTDFVLESNTRKQYPTYKILLIAHSPVLKDMIKSSDTNSAYMDVSDEIMEHLIKFIHTGTLKDIDKDVASSILEIAIKFKFERLEKLLVYTLKE